MALINYHDSSQKYSGNLRSEIIPLLPEHYTATLEIGCADGEFSYKCLGDECLKWVIEPNAIFSDSLHSKGFERVFISDFFTIVDELPDDYFDLVICNDVIEHMHDHDLFLSLIKDKMKDGAVLVGSVPNMRYYKVLRDYLFKKKWEYQDSGILDKTHLRWFTFISLRETFLRHGYQIESLIGLNGTDRIKMFILLINIFLFGSQQDIKYQQIGFRVRKALSGL